MVYGGKRVFDSVHGFIHLDLLETQFIHSRVFQRLQHIHQLGVAYLVYPGGTHHRYEHSLGVMQLATEIYDHLILSTYDIGIVRNSQEEIFEHVPKFMSLEYEYYRKVLRFAALCHDIGHLPFSHAAEKYLLDEGGHEKWTAIIIQSPIMRPFWQKIAETSGLHISPSDVEDDVLRTAVGEKDLKILGHKLSFTPWQKILSEIITADFFGADRIDYLLRDAKYTGITYGLFDYHQLIEMLRIICVKQLDKSVLKLGVEEEGIESCEALLTSRYFMHRRICHYATVKAYTWHLKRFMQTCYSNTPYITDLEKYLEFSEHIVLTDMSLAEKDPSHPGHVDAVSFLNYDKRCKAISLSSPFNQDELGKILEQQNIPYDKIACEVNSYDMEYQTTLDFPVLKKDGSITNCNNLSKITIPTPSSSWLYVSSDFEKKVRQCLGAAKC